jgi:hypothetical protein
MPPPLAEEPFMLDAALPHADPRAALAPHHGFLFATGIENSAPTIEGGRIRRDQMEECGHYARWREDFALVTELGCDALRYGPQLHRTLLGPGRHDWSFADETFADLNRACSVGVGACLRNGVRQCSANGAATECNEAPGAAGVEVCNAIDDDCDGRTDEQHPTLGQACSTGQGVCRRDGVFACNANNRAGPVVCSAPVVNPASPNEVCDYQDDNCNGRVDEFFLDAQSRYVSLENCGACGNDCNNIWNDNPAAFGVAPRCGVVNNVAQCLYDCLPGFVDADRVSNNGCELQIDPQAVYVSTPANGGLDNANCGALATPCASIGFGIGRAQALPRLRVLVSEGVYRESITLVSGVNVLGGHNRTTWIRNAALSPTIINGRTLAGIHRKVVTAIGITNADTTFDGFTINGESPLSEGNSYGIYVRDSNARLRITNNRVFAGDGGRGTAGAVGGNGTAGVAGAVGRNSFSVLSGDGCFVNPPQFRSGGGLVLISDLDHDKLVAAQSRGEGWRGNGPL